MSAVIITVIVLLGLACAVLLILVFRYHGRLASAEMTSRLLEQERGLTRSLQGELSEARARADRLALRLESIEAQDDASARISTLLAPLKERMELFNSFYSKGREQDAAARQKILDGIERMMSLNESIGREARNLASALTSNGKVQGDWGEAVLTRILQQSGLEEGTHYAVQLARDADGRQLLDDNGKPLRPDVVIMFPDERSLVVDSKVSLTDYLRICEAASDSEAAAARKAHVASIRRHIDELARKNYQKYIKNAADQVILFMPVEGAFMEGMRGDDSLWLYAWQRRVVIASPTHILSVIQLIEQLWRREERNRNAEEIASMAGLLYDRFASFASELLKVERGLDATRKAFDSTIHRLTSGRMSVVATVQRLGKTAPGSRRPIPDRFVVADEDASIADASGESAHEPGSLEVKSE